MSVSRIKYHLANKFDHTVTHFLGVEWRKQYLGIFALGYFTWFSNPVYHLSFTTTREESRADKDPISDKEI